MAQQKTRLTILATIATPFMVSILLLLFSLLGLNISNPQAFHFAVHDFSGTLVKVTFGHLLTFCLIIFYLYNRKNAAFLPIAAAAIVTQLFWRQASNLAYMDCGSGSLCSQKVTEAQNTTITYIIGSLLLLGAIVFYFSFVRNRK